MEVGTIKEAKIEVTDDDSGDEVEVDGYMFEIKGDDTEHPRLTFDRAMNDARIVFGPGVEIDTDGETLILADPVEPLAAAPSVSASATEPPTPAAEPEPSATASPPAAPEPALAAPEPAPAA
jgi:hypothetical protein